jgi:hypothetical protein
MKKKWLLAVILQEILNNYIGEIPKLTSWFSMAAGLPFSPHRNSMGEILGHSLYLLKFVF